MQRINGEVGEIRGKMVHRAVKTRAKGEVSKRSWKGINVPVEKVFYSEMLFGLWLTG